MSIVFERGQRILFIGDSITDAGRLQSPEWGTGYVHMARALLLSRYPELGLEVLNRGVGGNTVRDLKERWEEDAIALRPDWLSVKIGINDVWRAVEGREREAVPLDEYEATYDALLTRSREAGARLILMEPYVIEPDREDPFRRLIDAYAAVVHALAERHGALLVRTQRAFDRGLEAQPKCFWAGDRVHPGAPGHALIARAWLRGVGYGDV
ncbi:MAG TPA: SGNH/GDSL hydrolase family protein [Candidatus Dormibacteraeota bacterium]|jgi:lysophospholipase L1-like esterase|nr:SGNH/GDSL hydrolase family protein [Candidatus Dormibacteraeota bacterium]